MFFWMESFLNVGLVCTPVTNLFDVDVSVKKFNYWLRIVFNYFLANLKYLALSDEKNLSYSDI